MDSGGKGKKTFFGTIAKSLTGKKTVGSSSKSTRQPPILLNTEDFTHVNDTCFDIDSNTQLNHDFLQQRFGFSEDLPEDDFEINEDEDIFDDDETQPSYTATTPSLPPPLPLLPQGTPG